MNTPHLVSLRRFTRSVLFSMLPVLFGTISSYGQAVAPATASDQSTKETITLSPFEVRSTNSGYLAAEASTGSRYAAPVKEIPFPVNVISSEFIERFLAFDFSDAVAYTSSFTYTGGTGAFNLRGVRNFSHYKNGIREGGVYGPISVDRIEVIKGANASIYGATEPTGLRNIVTKKAGPKPSYTLWVNAGGDDFSRVAIDVNQPLVKDKLLTRFAASTEHSEQYIQDFAAFRRQVAYNSTTWRIGSATALTTNIEYIKFRSQAQNAAGLPFVLTPSTVNGVAVNVFTGILGGPGYRSFQHLNLAGPTGYNDVEYTQIDGTLTHEFNDIFSVRVLGNHWSRYQNIFRSFAVLAGTNNNTYNSVTGQIPGTVAPRLERNRQWQDNAQIDLLAHFHTGGIEHKFLLTADYLIVDTDARQRTSLRADRFITLNDFLTGGPTFSPTFPYSFDFGNADVWGVRTFAQLQQTIMKGVMVSERAAFAGGRLIAYAGARHDWTRNALTDQLNPIRTIDGQTIPINTKFTYPAATADTMQFGAVYKVTPAISAYGNYSEAFSPQRTDLVTNIDADGNPLPNITGKGWETGIKASLFNDRLNFTLGYYDILRGNVPRVARDATGAPILIPGTTPGTTRQYSVLNDISSKGYELDFNWRVTDAFNAFGGIGYNTAKFATVPNPTEQFLLGVTPDNSPRWTGGVGVEYRFTTGRLKGFSTRLGVRYQGSMLINNSTASIAGNSGVRGANVTIGGISMPQYFFSNPGYTLIDVGFGYSWKAGGYSHRISVDLKNVLDQKYLRANVPGDPFTANLSYQLKL